MTVEELKESLLDDNIFDDAKVLISNNEKTYEVDRIDITSSNITLKAKQNISLTFNNITV